MRFSSTHTQVHTDIYACTHTHTHTWDYMSDMYMFTSAHRKAKNPVWSILLKASWQYSCYWHAMMVDALNSVVNIIHIGQIGKISNQNSTNNFISRHGLTDPVFYIYIYIYIYIYNGGLNILYDNVISAVVYFWDQ